MVAKLHRGDLGPGDRLAGFRIDDLARYGNRQLELNGRRLGRRCFVNAVRERAVARAIPLLRIVRLDPDADPAEGRIGRGDAEDAVVGPVRDAVFRLRLVLAGAVQLDTIAERLERLRPV